MTRLKLLQEAERISASVSKRVIRTDGGTQYRDVLDQSTIDDYKHAIKDGQEFPPLLTVFDGEIHWLVDGFHRYQAHLLLGTASVSVSYVEGTKEDAQLLALTANTQHGLRRNIPTKTRVVTAALANPELNGLSDYELSKLLGVSAPFVTGVRNPEVKSRQQAARDRHAARRLQQEVKNPIQSANAYEWDGGDPPEDSGPDEDEIRAAELAEQANRDALYKILNEDEPLKEAFAEIERLNKFIAHMEIRFMGLMNEKNVAVKMVKDLQSQLKRISGSQKATIKIGTEADERNKLVKQMAPVAASSVTVGPEGNDFDRPF